MTSDKTKAAGSSVPLETLVRRLIEMHNNPPDRIGWYEQTTLREAAKILSELASDPRQAGLYVGKVQYVRAGGNAGLAWYVAPDYESIDHGYQPNDGDRLYAVPPNAELTGRGGSASEDQSRQFRAPVECHVGHGD